MDFTHTPHSPQATTAAFNWELNNPLLSSGMLKVYPKSGRIPVGGSLVCKVTLFAGGSGAVLDPRIIETDLICNVTILQEQTHGKRHKHARRGSTSRLRRKGEFLVSAHGESIVVLNQRSHPTEKARAWAPRGGSQPP